MKLELEFIIYSLIIILTLIPFFIYREKVFYRFYKIGNIHTFLRNIDSYLILQYPKIYFNYNIVKKVADEKDIRIKETLIIEDLVKQFANYEYELRTQKSVPKNKLWNNYEKNSKLIKDNKLPIDWIQRKEVAWLRDDNKCNRCGKKIKLLDTHILLAKQMRNGGGFNLENIIIVCSDCNRVIKSSNIGRTVRNLRILDNLMRKVTS